MGRDHSLRVSVFGKFAQRSQNAAEIMRREAVLGLFNGNESEERRTQLIDVECIGVAGKHRVTDGPHGENERNIKQRLLPVAQPGEVDLRRIVAGREAQAEVPQQIFDFALRERQGRMA